MLSAAKVSFAVAIVLVSGSLTRADSYSSGTKRHAFSSAEMSAAGPRMIEVRRGLWISNYECVTDEGYGRFLSCSAN